MATSWPRYDGQVTTKPLEPQVYLNTPGQIGTYSAIPRPSCMPSIATLPGWILRLARMSVRDFARVTGQDGYQVWQNYRPAPGSIIRQWSVDAAQDVALNETAFWKTLVTRRRGRQAAAGRLLHGSQLAAGGQSRPRRAIPAYHDCGHGQRHVQDGRARGAGVGDGYAVGSASAERRCDAVRPGLCPLRLWQDGQGRFASRQMG